MAYKDLDLPGIREGERDREQIGLAVAHGEHRSIPGYDPLRIDRDSIRRDCSPICNDLRTHHSRRVMHEGCGSGIALASSTFPGRKADSGNAPFIRARLRHDKDILQDRPSKATPTAIRAIGTIGPIAATASGENNEG